MVKLEFVKNKTKNGIGKKMEFIVVFWLLFFLYILLFIELKT